MPPSAGPIPGVPSNGNGMSPTTPEDAPDVPNGMSSDELPQANLPTLSLADLPGSMPSAEELKWAVPTYAVADAAEDHYALETRAESVNVLADGDAVRRGEIDYLRTGYGERFTDAVSGEETVEVDGLLLERIGRSSTLAAQKSETTVHGRMSISAVGWKSNAFSGEDSIMLGGALTDTWTGGLLIASAMSDDLVIGVGARLTAPVDMWLNQLTGMEERPGTAAADGVMVDLAGTLFEREYGVGTHESAMVVFSGSVYQTQRLGFWPMMRVAVGVRNLLPGAGTAASESAPPSPPPAAAGAAGGALVATNMVGGAAGSLRSGDMLPDAIRGAEAAEDLQEISNLRHADNTAVQLDELATAARNVEVEVPNGMGAAELPDAMPPMGVAGDPGSVEAVFSPEELSAMVDAMDFDDLRATVPEGLDTSEISSAWQNQIDDLYAEANRLEDGTEADQQHAQSLRTAADKLQAAVDDLNAGFDPLEDLMMKLDITESVRQSSEWVYLEMGYADEAAVLRTAINQYTDLMNQWQAGSQLDLAARNGLLDDLHSAMANGLGEGLESGQSSTSWPRALAQGEDAQHLQLAAEIDAARTLVAAIDDGEDPMTAVLRLMEEAKEAYGLNDPRTQAYVDLAAWTSAEYAGLLDELTSAAPTVSGLEDVRPTVQPGAPYARTPADSGTGLDMPTPQLTDEFRSGEELRRITDTSTQAGQLGSALRLDNMRSVLDVEVENVADVVQEGSGAGLRLDGVGVLNDVEAGPPVQPRLDDGGADWVGTEGAIANVGGDGLPAPRGDYQHTQTAADGGSFGRVGFSPDTQAVVDNMPVHAAPEGTDWHKTFDALNDDYMGYRRESTWRVMAEYEGAIQGLRDDLRRAITDFGGDADQFTAQTPVLQLYDAVQELLGKAETAEDARRIQEFLDGFDAQTYDLYGDLVQRGDEFEGIRSGTTFPLDRHIDQDKLTEFLEQRFMDAMANADPTNQASRDEVAFYQQAHLAAKEGRNPLVDLGDQISYLRGKFDVDVPIEDLPENLQTTALQAQNFQLHQQELIDLLSDPAFHKSAAVVGDDTYAPVNFLRPELGNAPSAGVGGVQTRIFDSEVAQLGGGTDTVSGNYAANQQVINDQVGGNDFARVPEVPEGIEPQPVQVVEEAPQGPRGILRNADAGGGPVGLDNSRIINRGPDGENVPDEIMELWAERMLDESNEAARGGQGGYGNYMDQMAELRTRHQQMEDRVARNPYAAARVEAANQMWNAQRGRDVRPPAEWDRAVDRNGMRSWDHHGWRLPPTDRPRVRKSVRFGGADVLAVPFDAEDVRKARNQFRDTDQGNAALNWWTGSGINRPTEALDADEAVRHVPTPRLATDRPSYPSSWRASRQPGFGRLADAPGTFPVNAREQMITELMQGKRLDSSHIDLLQGTLSDAVRADRVQHREWLKMNALLRSLRGGVVLGDTRSFSRALDSKTLATMLDMLESAATAL